MPTVIRASLNDSAIKDDLYHFACSTRIDKIYKNIKNKCMCVMSFFRNADDRKLKYL